MSDRLVSEEDRFVALERAESRLATHAQQRSEWRARRARSRIVRAWLLALAILPLAGAVAFVAVLEAAGGDLGGWPRPAAIAVTVVAFLLPAALSGVVTRMFGRWDAVGLAACTLLIEVALVFGVAFAALGYGPE